MGLLPYPRAIFKALKVVLTIILLVAAGHIFARADIREQGPADSSPSGLFAGVARADITPPVGIPIQNWGAQTHIESVGIHYPLVVNALVLSDGKETFCMVDYDGIVTGSSAGEMRRRIEARTGIPYEHIRVAVSHTHAGPALKSTHQNTPEHVEAVRRWHENVVEKAAGAAWEAQQRLEPVHIGGSKGECRININRRFRAHDNQPEGVGMNPDGFVDHDVIVARIDNATGNPIAVIVNYQCHGTVLAWENTHVSPDYPGFVRKAVEESIPGVICLFFNGGAGDQGPIEGFTGDLRVPERLGRILGFKAASIALGIETVRREPVFEGFTESTAFLVRQPWRVMGPKSGKLAFTEKMITLPRRRVEDLRILEQQVIDAEKGMQEARASGDAWKISQAKSRHKRLSDRLIQWKSWQTAGPLTMKIQALRIGEIALFAMPGEPFSQIGAAIKKNSPFPFTMFCGYSHADGTVGWKYMPVAEEYDKKGYEVYNSPFGRESAGIVIEEAGRLLNEVCK